MMSPHSTPTPAQPPSGEARHEEGREVNNYREGKVAQLFQPAVEVNACPLPRYGGREGHLSTDMLLGRLGQGLQ